MQGSDKHAFALFGPARLFQIDRDRVENGPMLPKKKKKTRLHPLISKLQL